MPSPLLTLGSCRATSGVCRATFGDEVVAAALMQALRDFTPSIPAFENPDRTAVETVRKRTYLPAAFIKAGVDAIIVSEELQAIPQLEADVVRDDRQYVDAFRPLLRDLARSTRGLQFTIAAKEARRRACVPGVHRGQGARPSKP